MNDINLRDLYGQWWDTVERANRSYDLRIGNHGDSSFGICVFYNRKEHIQTRELTLTELTENNTRFLKFSNDFELEIRHYENTIMTVEIEGVEVILEKRVLD